MTINWEHYPNFSKEEFDCKETGENEMQPVFLYELQKLRDAFGRPMPINSGYRARTHSKERHKPKGGTHTQGIACDIGTTGMSALEKRVLIRLIHDAGCFNGLGIANSFIHIDTRKGEAFWTYA